MLYNFLASGSVLLSLQFCVFLLFDLSFVQWIIKHCFLWSTALRLLPSPHPRNAAHKSCEQSLSQTEVNFMSTVA